MGGTRCRRTTLGALALAGALLASLPAAAAAGKPPACLTPDSWTAGTTDLCRGTIIYNDYVFDDHGADTGRVLTNRIGNLSPTAGDQRYPKGQEGTADLVRLTMRPRQGKLRIKGLLSALYSKRSTVLAVAIDSDDDRSTGGGRWGDLDISSRGWDQIRFFDRGDLRRNTIRGRMPIPERRRWRVQAVTANAARNQVMNVAFRGPNERSRFGEGATSPGSAVGAWFEDEQAGALASGNITRFGKTITSRHLRKRKTRTQRVASGFHERVYRSKHTLPPHEGYSYEGVPGRGDGGGDISLGFEQSFNFLGRYQPYGIYLPERRGPHGVQMLFHGSSANLASLVGQPGMQERFGEQLNRILVTPEGRGTEGWASDISERDLLDVIRDVKRSYDVDRDRVFAGGYSQGGYATYRMAGLHPDIFAGAVDWVGFTGSSANGSPPGAPAYTAGAVGNAPDFIGNLLHVPTVMLYAGADELVQINQGLAISRAFRDAGNVFRFYNHPAAEHFTFAGLDDWRKEARYTRGMRRVRNPARVRYSTARFLDAPQFGIRHDGAYWISKMRTRGGKRQYGTADLTSAGCGGTTPVLRRSSGAGTDPVPWTSDDQRVVSRERIDRTPRLSGRLTALSGLRVDADRSCLAGKRVRYSIRSDGPATISFSDGRRLRIREAGLARGTLPR